MLQLLVNVDEFVLNSSNSNSNYSLLLLYIMLIVIILVVNAAADVIIVVDIVIVIVVVALGHVCDPSQSHFWQALMAAAMLWLDRSLPQTFIVRLRWKHLDDLVLRNRRQLCKTIAVLVRVLLLIITGDDLAAPSVIIVFICFLCVSTWRCEDTAVIAGTCFLIGLL